MNREDFLDGLREQYASEIHELYVECEHDQGKTLDVEGLQSGIRKVLRSAKVDGLPEKDFWELVQSTLPEEVHSQLQASSKAA